jgi:hypothetical protein
MNPQTAYQLLEQALEPQNVLRLTRRDYVNIAIALDTIKSILPPAEEPVSQMKVVPPSELEPQTP